jgi:hypothetical protein
MRANERGGFSHTQVATFAGEPVTDRRAREVFDVAVVERVRGGPGVVARR